MDRFRRNFFKNASKLNFISFLKVKANVGITGDDRVGARLWQARYGVYLPTGYIFGPGTASLATLNPSIVANPDISWSKKRTVNVGLESAFFGGKLTFGFDYFHDYTYGDFDRNNDANFPMYEGFVAPVLNHEEHHTYGTEFSFGYNNRVSKDLSFSVSTNFGFSSTFTSQVFQAPFKLFENTATDWQILQGVNTKIYAGGNLGLISKGILRTQADVDNLLRQTPNYTIYGTVPKIGFMNYEDTNKDGKIDDHDIVPMYKNGVDPIISLGTSFGINYKGFQLRTNFVARLGGKERYDSKVSSSQPTLTKNISAVWADHWTVTNPNGKFPSVNDPNGGKASTFWMVDATMIRINNMSLAYAIPNSVLARTGISNLRVLITGNNLWTIVNPQPFKDPYSGSTYDYPTIRTISVGLGFGI